MRNFEKFTKRQSRKSFTEFEAKGRKLNKVKRDRSHKRTEWA